MKTTRRTSVARAASSTVAVPPTFTAASKYGSSTDLRTSIWAARWKTSSGRVSARTAPTAAPWRPATWASRAPLSSAFSRLARRPVDRSSRTVTSSPRAINESTRLEPMNPAPPVTKLFIRGGILSGFAGGRRGIDREDAEKLPTRPCYPRRPMRLIVTEKNSSAKKIAEVLGAPSGGPKADKTFKVPFYTWTNADGRDEMAIGLKGHVLGPAFPEGYSNWQKTDLHDLIDADLIKEATDKNVVKAIKKMRSEADELVIATDFDREGELIGLEALEEMLDANPALGTREDTAKGTLKILRARYSATTKEELLRAFDNLDYLSY